MARHGHGANVGSGALGVVFICAVLSVLEVSLSFDNAVVNAAVLRNMTPLWRHRFLTWGILIAVFGMRIVFPLVIVGVVAALNPWDAIVLAATNPDEYARLMQSAHIPVAAFGGAFLLMVALKYFFDTRKDVHWISHIERPLIKLGKLGGVELATAMIILYAISRKLSETDALTFLVAGIFGLITFILVDGVSSMLEGGDHKFGETSDNKTEKKTKSIQELHKASAGMFLYLEVLDASFSFDGVVGAFAITNNLFIIAIGLGIGAMFVRSLTILLVDKGTLTEYVFLEHGAFYAIGALAAIMFLNTFVHIHEVVTGLIGAAFIGMSFISSIRYNKKQLSAAPARAHK
ncbi:MAG: DUF475 domain-containing protein [Bdellovibrionota bacterium]